MVTVVELQARVEAAYAGLDLPSWPDPHPGLARPREEEYSRLTDPERYRIVHARARTWARVLVDALDVVADHLPGGVRLACRTDGTAPLLLMLDEVELPVLRLCVADESWVLAQLPDCGCDACDDGSAGLLRAIDEMVTGYVAGPAVLMRGDGWSSYWHPGGGHGSGGPGSGGSAEVSFPDLWELSSSLAAGDEVELPPATDVVLNHSWLTS